MKCHALLIGINQYHPLAPLSYARDDASAFKLALEQDCGFDSHDITLMQCGVNGGLRADRDYIKAQLDELLHCKDLDLLIFGFWGHGFSQQGNHRYLCSISTSDSDLARTAISLGIVNETLRQVGARNTVIILDCCQNRASGRDGMAPVLEAGSRGQYETAARDIQSHRTETGRGPATTAILSACGEGQRAYEWPARGHGIFTGHLLEGLKKGKTRISELVEYVQENTPHTARQVIQKPQDPFLEMKGGGDIDLAGHATPPPPAKQSRNVLPRNTWWLFRNGETEGPFTEDQISNMALEKKISRTTLIWREGQENWQQAASFPTWQNLFPALPPPLWLQVIAETNMSKDEETRKLARACEKNDAAGFYKLGLNYANNRGVSGTKKERYRRAKALFTKASDLGLASGYQGLGWMYQYNLGIGSNKAKRDAKAVELYGIACEMNDPFGCISLGMMYKANRGVNESKSERNTKTVLLFEKACALGNADGCFNLGVIYETKQGVSGKKAELTAKAIKYYTKSCELGDAESCVRAAELIQKGQLNNKIYIDGAAKLYQKAISLGDTKSSYSLGLMYANSKLYKKAIEQFLLASEMGHPEACNSLGVLYILETSSFRTKSKRYSMAIRSFEKASKLGNSNGHRNLSLMKYQIKLKHQIGLNRRLLASFQV